MTASPPASLPPARDADVEAVFSGDTVFIGGVGAFFHGDAADMERRGDVTVSVIGWNGDADARQALEDVYAAFHTFAAYHRDETTTALGLDAQGLQWTRPGADERFSQDQDELGAWAVLVFTINFYQYLTP